MFALETPVSLLAVTSGIATLTIAAYLLLRHRTAILRYFACFNAAIFAMTVGFALRSLASDFQWMSVGSSHEPVIREFVAILNLTALAFQGLGSIVLTAILPFFSQSLFDRQPMIWWKRVGFASSGLLLAFLVLYANPDGRIYAGWALSIVLFANIGLCLAMVGRALKRPQPSPPRLPQPATAATLRHFLVLTVLCFPLFIADMVISGLPSNLLIRALDNTSLPLYLILVNLGAIGLLRRTFDHPPFFEGDRVSDFGRQHYQLTEREATVLEYIMDGYTVKDLAGVLKIAPKTAENHLYSVYQKTGVSNRMQLFQLFQNQRRTD